MHSGFDRGHLTPAGDHAYSQKAMDDTFLLTNISPQVGVGFNRHYWARLEQFSRDLLKEWTDLYLCTGPLFVPETENDGKTFLYYEVIGHPPRIAVPTHFYKVMLAQKDTDNQESSPPSAVGAFILPNKPIPPNIPLEQFATTLDRVEELSGLDFFPKIKENNISSLSAPENSEIDQSSEPLLLNPPSGSPLPSISFKQLFDLCNVSKCVLPPPDFWKVSDEKKILLEEKVVEFANSSENEYSFPSNLSSAERKIVHDKAEKYNLQHISILNEGERCLILKKQTPSDLKVGLAAGT